MKSTPPNPGADKEKVSTIEVMKRLLSDPLRVIELDDFTTEHLKTFIEKTSLDHFPVQGGSVSKEEFLERIKKYDGLSEEMETITELLAYWSTSDRSFLIEKIFRRICETDKGQAGTVIWINLGWYPAHLLMYASGIAALAKSNYVSLRVILESEIRLKYENDGKPMPLVIPATLKIERLNDQFKWFPGRERNHTPRSEYLFELLRPKLNELFFLGQSYEELFDKFECFLGLVFADKAGKDWGTYGRFAWKYASPVSADNPFRDLIEEAKKAGENWGPLKAGLFGGSQKRFEEVAGAFEKQLSAVRWI
jgi:hypothetical protein